MSTVNENYEQMWRLLEFQKRQLRELQERQRQRQELEESSLDSGHGSQGGSSLESDDFVFRPAFGAQLKRELDLKHKESMERFERRRKRFQLDSVLPPFPMPLPSFDTSQFKDTKKENTETEEDVKEGEKEIVSKEEDESDEEELYGADEEELKQMEKMKDKFATTETDKDSVKEDNDNDLDQEKVVKDFDHLEDDKKSVKDTEEDVSDHNENIVDEQVDQEGDIPAENPVNFSNDEVNPRLFDAKFSSDSESHDDYDSDGY